MLICCKTHIHYQRIRRRIFSAIIDIHYTLIICEVRLSVCIATTKTVAGPIIIMCLSAVWLDPTQADRTESSYIIVSCYSEILK